MNLTTFRQEYPHYNDLSDAALAERLYRAHYSDMPRATFYKRLGLNEPDAAQQHDFTPTPYGTSEPGQLLSGIADIARGFGNAFAIRPINFALQEGTQNINHLFNTHFIPKQLGEYRMELPNKDAAKYGGMIGNIWGAGALAALGGRMLFGIGGLGGAGFLPGLGRVALGTAGGGLLGAAESPQDRMAGAGWGAFGGAAGNTFVETLPKAWPVLKAFAGNKKAQMARVLSYLGKQNRKGAILSPQTAKEHFTTHYVDTEGNALPVDIGTVVHSPALQAFRQSLPWTDVNSTVAAVDKAAIHRELQNANAIREALKNRIIADTDTQLPAALNNLTHGLKTRAAVNQSVADTVRAAYKGVKKSGNQLYDPLNNATVRFDQQALPEYQRSATDLLSQRINLENIFGDDADLGASLSRELTHANRVLSNKATYGLTLPETIQRSQQLGTLARAAKNRSHFNEARLLNNLKVGLDADVRNGLVQQGRQDLADQLDKANQFWATHVVPYHGNSVLRKTVLHQHTPIKDELAKQLLDPQYESQLNHIDMATKNGLAYQLITRGRGTSAGRANLSADKIGSTYAQLPGDYKKQIARFNPYIDELFERAPAVLEHNKVLAKAVSDWDKKIERLKAQQFGRTPSQYKTKMPPLPKHLGELLALPFSSLGRARLSAYARFGMPWANRSWEEVLTSPALRERYFESLPQQLGQPTRTLTKKMQYGAWLPALGSPAYSSSNR